ncbi:MAG TPA: DedA family protein [Nitrososphaeraceae archaeon]|nr:DedA family protein [Nitrososphaeraceae archaeon]
MFVYYIIILLTIYETFSFQNITDTITSWIFSIGYLGVFAATLLETIFPPIPSEVIFPLIGFTAQSKGLGLGNAIGMATIGALGSTVGAIMIYFIALKIGRPAILRVGKYVLINESKLQRAELWFEKHGTVAVLAGRLAPGIREIISIPAGLGKMNIGKFILFTFAGSLIWSISLTIVGFYFGETWSKFAKESSGIFNMAALLIIVGVAAVIGFGYYKEHKSSTKDNNLE